MVALTDVSIRGAIDDWLNEGVANDGAINDWDVSDVTDMSQCKHHHEHTCWPFYIANCYSAYQHGTWVVKSCHPLCSALTLSAPP